MARRVYENTTVLVEESQRDIRAILARRGAEAFQFGEMLREGQRWASVEFVHNDVMVRIQAPLKPDRPDTRHISTTEKRATKDEREAQRIWRVLHWTLKARMEAVDEGVETFEQAFLAHIVDPRTSRTVWQVLAPSIEAGRLSIGGAGLPQLGSGS